MVQGLDRFKRRWLAVPKAVRREFSAEMEEIAQEIVDAMYALAPHLTGDLGLSIRWTWGTTPRGSVTLGTVGRYQYSALRITIYAGGTEATKRTQNRASGTRKRDQKRTGTFETDVAILQEFGTQNMPANPFFFPVWRAKKKGVKSRLARRLRKAIRLA